MESKDICFLKYSRRDVEKFLEQLISVSVDGMIDEGAGASRDEIKKFAEILEARGSGSNEGKVSSRKLPRGVR